MAYVLSVHTYTHRVTTHSTAPESTVFYFIARTNVFSDRNRVRHDYNFSDMGKYLVAILTESRGEGGEGDSHIKKEEVFVVPFRD